MIYNESFQNRFVLILVTAIASFFGVFASFSGNNGGNESITSNQYWATVWSALDIATKRVKNEARIHKVRQTQLKNWDITQNQKESCWFAYSTFIKKTTGCVIITTLLKSSIVEFQCPNSELKWILTCGQGKEEHQISTRLIMNLTMRCKV